MNLPAYQCFDRTSNGTIKQIFAFIRDIIMSTHVKISNLMRPHRNNIVVRHQLKQRTVNLADTFAHNRLIHTNGLYRLVSI